jgi:hypothetical protein
MGGRVTNLSSNAILMSAVRYGSSNKIDAGFVTVMNSPNSQSGEGLGSDQGALEARQFMHGIVPLTI